MNIDKDALESCINYLLQNEWGDYEVWCDDNDINPKDYKNNTAHVYACALIVSDSLKKEKTENGENRDF